VLYWGVIGYIVTTLLLVVPSLIFHGRFPWNPLSWPLAAQIGYAAYVAWNTYVGFHGDLRRNGNVYWNSEPIERYSLDEPVFLRSTKTKCDGRLSTLTVTAPYLDEALLGMIGEQLLLGRMRPELRKFVVPESAGRSGQRVASGERFTHMVAVRRLLSDVLQRIKGGILALVYLIIRLPWRAISSVRRSRLDDDRNSAQRVRRRDDRALRPGERARAFERDLPRRHRGIPRLSDARASRRGISRRDAITRRRGIRLSEER